MEIYNEPKLSKYTTAPDRLPETSTREFGESVSLLWAYLRVFEESLLVVWAPPCPVRFLPGAVRQPLMPGLVQGEERGVDHTADGRLVEVLAEILKRHPEQGMKKKNVMATLNSYTRNFKIYSKEKILQKNSLMLVYVFCTFLSGLIWLFWDNLWFDDLHAG